jgi:ATP-dependent exoDNAse (exonuclease V) beta subunit
MSPNLNLLPQYHVKQVRSQGKSYYVDDRGQQLPSVTTILNATRSAEQWERLANWKQRVGAEEAQRISSTASRRGTGTHRQIQRYLRGEGVQCSETVKPYWQSVEPILQKIDTVRLVEGTVFHYELGYAGQVDCVASYQGIPCVCEWKTADRPKESVDRLYDYPLQLAAYWGAVNQFYQDHDLNLAHALLVVAVPEMPAEVFWFDSAAIQPYWQQWEERVALFWRRLGYFRQI